MKSKERRGPLCPDCKYTCANCESKFAGRRLIIGIMGVTAAGLVLWGINDAFGQSWGFWTCLGIAYLTYEVLAWKNG